MDDKDFELTLKRAFSYDYSIGTENFRDALLARCLAALVLDFRSRPLADDELDLLAAAGNPYILDDDAAFGDNTNTSK